MSENPRPIIHVLSGDLWGGKEAQLALQLPMLRSMGADVRVLALNDGEVTRRLVALGIPTLYAEERRGLLSCFRTFRRHLRDVRPGVIVSHGYKENILAACASVLHGIPWVPVFHGFSEKLSGLQGTKADVYNSVSRFLSRVRAARVITVSTQLAVDLGFSRDDRLRVVRNVVRAATPGASPSDLETLLPAGARAAIAIGRLAPVKRINLLLQAFARAVQGNELPADACLLIAGDGPERAGLEAESSRLGLGRRCFFLGFRNDVPSLLSGSEVFVLCSDSEGIPTALLEALSLEKKIVVTRVGGIPEVLAMFPDYPAEVVAPGDEIELGTAIVRAFRRIEGAPADTAEILQKFFSPEVAASVHLAMYKELSGVT